AFLISTPQTGVDSIIATFGLMGAVFAVYRPVAAFISGAAGGALIQKIAGNRTIEGEASCAADGQMCGCAEEAAAKPSLAARIKSMARYAFVEFVDDISIHFIIGVAAAAAITMIIPAGFFDSINLGSGIQGMLLMLAVGFPMYICSTSSIPIAVALMIKGISPGAAFVFLFAGPATNAASMAVLAKKLGKKTMVAYLAVMAVCAVGFGLLLDALIRWFALPMPEFGAAAIQYGAGPLQTAAGIVFGVILLRSIAAKLIRRIRSKKTPPVC
ncbi:MAG: permease, partial [Eubacteriales bacterium]|nr:permease [Eubacteriales bacterium]